MGNTASDLLPEKQQQESSSSIFFQEKFFTTGDGIKLSPKMVTWLSGTTLNPSEQQLREQAEAEAQKRMVRSLYHYVQENLHSDQQQTAIREEDANCKQVQAQEEEKPAAPDNQNLDPR